MVGNGNGNGTSPCASCKLLRRRCAKDCIFAPYFPSDDPLKFAIVHKVFGASNISKMLQELGVHQRADAVSSIVYEANARMRDPVYGCVGAISLLQNQVSQLQMQLAVAQAEILCIQMQQQQQEDEEDQPAAAAAHLIHHHDHHLHPHHHHHHMPINISDHDENSYLLHNNNFPDHPHCLNFASNSSTVMINEYSSFKRESLFGHDLVS